MASTITIRTGIGDGDDADASPNSFAGSPSGTIGTVTAADTTPTTLFETEMESILGTISLAATSAITINDLADNNLTLAQTSGNSVSFTAPTFTMSGAPTDTITTAGGALSIDASTSATIGGLNTNGGLIALNIGTAGTVSGVIAGTGTALTKTGAGSLTLSGNNTYTGQTTVAGGVLIAANANALGSTAGGTAVAGFATLEIANVAIGNESVTLAGAISGTGVASLAGAILLTSNNVAVIAGAGDSLTLSGVIDDGASTFLLGKLGAGTVILSGANTYGGITIVSSGTLVAANNSALGTTENATTVSSGATLQIANGITVAESITVNGSGIGGNGALTGDGTAAVSGAITLGTSATVGATAASTLTLSGVIADGAGTSLTKVGLGTVVLSNAGNSYTGGTNINGGTLSIGADANLGAVAALTFDGGTLEATATFALNAGRAITLNAGGGTFQVDPGFELTSSSNISGAGDLTKTGTGTLVLGGANTYGGHTSINAGTLSVSGGAALSDFGAVVIATGATLELVNSETIGSLTSVTGATVSLGANTLTTGGLNTNTAFAGQITGAGGSLVKSGTGIFTLSGNNTFDGLITIATGTLVAATSTALGSSLSGTSVAAAGNLTISNAAIASEAVTLNGGNALTGVGTAILGGSVTLNADSAITVNGSDSFTIGGVIDGAGFGFTKAGTGTLVLTNADTYSGATTINSGTLFVDGSIISSATTVNNGGTLGGNGTVGAVSVLSGGTFSAGHSPGILVTGDLSLTSGAIFKAEIGGTTPGVSGYDQVQVHGTVSLGGAILDLSLVNAFVPSGAPTESFSLIDNDGTDAVTGQFAGLAEGAAVNIGSVAYAITYQGGSNNNDVVLVAANDPPTFAGAGDVSLYTENGSPVVLDVNGNVSITDLDLNFASDYGGTSLTIARNGGANPDDVFGVSGTVDLTDGNNIRLTPGGTVIGTYSIADGTISFTFNSNVLPGDIDFLMRHIVYSNTSDNPPASVQIDFTFSDGNGQPGGQDQGPGAAPGIGVGSFTVSVQQVNDSPEVLNATPLVGYTIGSAGVVLSPGLVVTDLDAAVPSTNIGIKNAVVAISDGYLPGDQLFVNLPNSGGFFIVDDDGDPLTSPVVTNISVQSNSFGRLVLAGTDTTQNYQLVLDAVSYRSTAADPSDNGLNSSRTITWQVNDGAALTAPLLAAPGPTYGTAASPFEGLTLDVNHDDILDLVVTTAAGISVLLGNGDGTFGTKTDINFGNSPRDIAAGDLNHDGNVDLAVAGFAGGVTVLLGDGAGGFTARPIVPTGSGPTGVAIADFNNDGHADLVVANALSNNISVLLGNGSGTYAGPVNTPVGTTPVAVTTGDFNGDGRIDIAAADQTSNDVAILLNAGGGNFGAATTFATGAGTAPIQIATADLNGDGFLDLVTANSSGNNVSVLLGNGVGGFGGPTVFPTGNQPHDVTIGDVDGDGFLDIVTADVTGAGITVMHGTGNGTFINAVPFAAGPGAAATMLGDFDRDGALDVAVVNFSISNVSVLLGNGTNNNAPVSTRLQFDQPPAVDLDGSGAGTGFTTSYTEGSAAIAIADTDLLVSDPDTAVLSHAKITITDASAGDSLSVAGALPAGIVASIDSSVAGQLTLLLAGNGSPSDYQAAIGQIRFSTTSLDVSDRDIAVQVFESEVDSNVAHATVHVLPLTATGTSGHDSFTAIAGVEFIDAGAGVDTITFNFKLVDATVTYSGNKVIIDGPGSHSVLSGFEVFSFTDGTVNNNDGDVLVDDLFYYSKYHDVWTAHADADAHYHTVGWKEGRDPDAFFSTVIYLSANPDVKAAGVDPLKHFDVSGWKEGRVPSLNFDPAAYLSANPDVKAAGVDPLAHFLQFGASEGRQPIAPTELIAANGFDYVYYLNHNPDVAAAGVDPLAHFQQFGWKEGRNPNALFDTTGYLNNYLDVKAANVNPLDHYNQFGWHEGRDPSVGFDTTSYLAAYPDVNAAHVNPLTHFLHFGIHEGRSPFADGLWG